MLDKRRRCGCGCGCCSGRKLEARVDVDVPSRLNDSNDDNELGVHIKHQNTSHQFFSTLYSRSFSVVCSVVHAKSDVDNICQYVS